MHVYIYPNSIRNAFDPSVFLGFTLDADQFEGDCETSCLWELNHPVVKNLCRELKPATIRIGGAGIDRFHFVDDAPAGSASTPGKYGATIDRRKCDALGEFCREVGAGLMLALPMRHGDVDNARRLARYFVQERKDRAPFLEFSNEPDWGWEEDAPSYPRRVRQFHKELAPLFPDQRWMGGYGGRFFPFGVQCSVFGNGSDCNARARDVKYAMAMWAPTNLPIFLNTEH